MRGGLLDAEGQLIECMMSYRHHFHGCPTLQTVTDEHRCYAGCADGGTPHGWALEPYPSLRRTKVLVGGPFSHGRGQLRSKAVTSWDFHSRQ